MAKAAATTQQSHEEQHDNDDEDDDVENDTKPTPFPDSADEAALSSPVSHTSDNDNKEHEIQATTMTTTTTEDDKNDENDESELAHTAQTTTPHNKVLHSKHEKKHTTQQKKVNDGNGDGGDLAEKQMSSSTNMNMNTSTVIETIERNEIEKTMSRTMTITDAIRAQEYHRKRSQQKDRNNKKKKKRKEKKHTRKRKKQDDHHDHHDHHDRDQQEQEEDMEYDDDVRELPFFIRYRQWGSLRPSGYLFGMVLLMHSTIVSVVYPVHVDLARVYAGLFFVVCLSVAVYLWKKTPVIDDIFHIHEEMRWVIRIGAAALAMWVAFRLVIAMGVMADENVYGEIFGTLGIFGVPVMVMCLIQASYVFYFVLS